MPAVYLFNYPDTGTEPAEFWDFIKRKQELSDSPSEEKIEKLNGLRSRLASLLVSQPNTKAILTVQQFCEKHCIIIYFRLLSLIFLN